MFLDIFDGDDSLTFSLVDVGFGEEFLIFVFLLILFWLCSLFPLLSHPGVHEFSELRPFHF